MRVRLPSGADVTVSPDVKPSTLKALDEMMATVKQRFERHLPMPTNEESVAWAEEAQTIADVLRELSDQFNGVDNGHCTICRQHRLYDTKSNVQPCENAECLSHRIAAILNLYERSSPETLERIKHNCDEAIRNLK